MLRVIAYAGTVVLLLLSACVVIPPVNMGMFPFTVGASEYSPILMVLCLAWTGIAYRAFRAKPTQRWVVLGILTIATLIYARPLFQFNRTLTSAASQLGGDIEDDAYSFNAALLGLPSTETVMERPIAYRAADGSPLMMRIFSEKRSAKAPLVVVVYGGAWRGGDAKQCANISRALAARGFVVAAVDYRHAPRFRFPAQPDDIRSSLAVIVDSATALGIDTSRIAILGRSSGGHLAELTAFSREPVAHIAALVSIYSPYDLIEGYTNLPSPDPIHIQSILRNFMGGTPSDMHERYMAASPASFVRPGLPPTLLLFAGQDDIVKPEFNRRAANELRAAGVRVVAVELPWAAHGFDMTPAGLGTQLEIAVVARFLERELGR